jgi:hypothetical protein
MGSLPRVRWRNRRRLQFDYDYEHEHEHEQEQETVNPMGSLWNQFEIQYSKFSNVRNVGVFRGNALT